MVADNIRAVLESSSSIFKIFETGMRLKEEFGEDGVFDFSLGNPDLPPSEEFTRILSEKAADNSFHKYMPNAGYPGVREKIAEHISAGQMTGIEAGNVVVTCGAGGALNTVFKTILNPGDNVIVPIPYFMEYYHYVGNHGGKLRPVAGTEDFDIDVTSVERAIDINTAAVLINSPNNPSGRVFPKETLQALASMLQNKAVETGRTVCLVSDEPYRHIVYDGIVVPSVMDIYPHTVVCDSCSKALSIPGERIGWAAVHPGAEDADKLAAGISHCNRVLGFVNAPALMQRTVADLVGTTVDIEIYRRRRDYLAEHLAALGYRFCKPEGTFYMLIEAPGGDDVAFAEALAEDRILVVPGAGFGLKGYVRLAFCVHDRVIEASMPAFARAAEKLGLDGRRT